MSIMNMSLNDKVAVVTGSRRGIGKATALMFAEAGADVAVCDNVIEDGELEEVGREIQGLGRRSIAVQTDVSKKNQVDELVRRVEKELGPIDLLVNNAAIPSFPPLHETTEETWDLTFDVNLKGCFLCSQAVVKGMIERKQGNIINISAVAGLRSDAGTAYGITKAGVALMTRALARDLGQYNIRVNAIAPGLIFTKMVEEAASFGGSVDEILHEMEKASPLRRGADPSEIASVALFLASKASSFVTGHTIVADGGTMA